MGKKNNDKIIKFYYKNNFLFDISVKNLNKSDTQIIGSFKNYITRKKINIERFLGITLQKCGFCKNNAFWILKIKKEGNIVDILDIVHPYNNYCKNSKVNNCAGTKYNPNSIIFVSTTRNISKEDALKLIKSRNKSPFYKENFSTIEEYNKSQTRDLDYYIKKYGKNGKEKFDAYLDKLKYSHSEQYYIDKLGEKEGKKHWELLSSLKDSVSFDFFKKKYPNDEIKAISEYKKRIDILKVTLDNMVKKYGNYLGNQKYNNFIKKIKEQYKSKVKDGNFNFGFIGNSVSKSSIVFFDKLVKELINLNIINDENDVQYGKKKEKAIYNENTQTCYFFDFLMKKYKIIIEYNGIRFHPKCQNDENFKHMFDKINDSNHFWNYDQCKIKTAEKYGYKVIIVWEDDKQKLENCIKQIKEIL